MQTTTVITSNDSQMIGNTGWTWADAIDASREHARDVRSYPDPAERALARFPEFGDGVDFLSGEGAEVSLDDVLEQARDARELVRTHRSPAQRIAHRHGECACFRR